MRSLPSEDNERKMEGEDDLRKALEDHFAFEKERLCRHITNEMALVHVVSASRHTRLIIIRANRPQALLAQQESRTRLNDLLWHR